MPYSKICLLALTLVVFSGCGSIKNRVNESLDKAYVGVENQKFYLKSTYGQGEHAIKKSYVGLKESLSDLASGFYENSFIQFFISDETVLKNRNNLVIWQNGSFDNEKTIIEKQLSKKYKNFTKPYENVMENEKFELLNEYYLQREHDEFKKSFSIKYPKPKIDKFKTDSQNLQKINEYKYQLQKSVYEWELNEKQTRKNVLSRVFETLYGNPIISGINYDPYNEELYLEIKSSKGSFVQKAILTVEEKEAKELVNNQLKISPIVYFSLEDNNIHVVGVSFIYSQRHYLAKISSQEFQNRSTLVYKNEQIDLGDIDVSYKMVSKNIQEPSWFRNLPHNGVIGYGIGDSFEEAKNLALKEIAQEKGVQINAQSTIQKVATSSSYDKRVIQNIDLKIEKINLEGAKTLKSEKIDGVWFVAVKL
ncbi:MAG: hypothetical protein IE909_02340 [Campylobacterales bacterium]|nr:hypothetical protein [Campylobacterales bacterium]